MTGSNASPAGLRRGFSLAELVVVALILGILAAVAVPHVTNAAARRRVDSVARRIVADLRLAQQTARLSGATQTVSFSDAARQYEVSSAADLDRAGEDYSVELSEDPYGASVVTSDFEGEHIIAFDGFGVPDKGGSIMIQIGGHLRMITVDSETGEATVSIVQPIVDDQLDGQEVQSGEVQVTPTPAPGSTPEVEPGGGP